MQRVADALAPVCASVVGVFQGSGGSAAGVLFSMSLGACNRLNSDVASGVRNSYAKKQKKSVGNWLAAVSRPS